MGIARNEELCEALAQEIEQVFADMPYPGGDNIGREDISVFRGDWRAIPLDVIIAYRGELPFFAIQGFRYYLPAFLVAALRHPVEVDTLLDNLIFNLDPKTYEFSGQRFTEIVNSFTLDEKRSILNFLGNYMQFFPGFPVGMWVYDDKILSDLQRATDFWQNTIQ